MAIGKESLSVTELVRTTGLSQTLISFHLRIMREADIVRTERNGPFIYYSLSDRSLLGILSALFQTQSLNDKEPDKNRKPEPTGKRAGKTARQSMQPYAKTNKRR
jgi:DNA-binding transcriptional ArsR family regulator